MSEQMKRVNVSLPDPIFEDLKNWAESRGQAAGTVAAIALELAIREAKDRGEVPQPEPHPTPNQGK